MKHCSIFLVFLCSFVFASAEISDTHLSVLLECLADEEGVVLIAGYPTINEVLDDQAKVSGFRMLTREQGLAIKERIQELAKATGFRILTHEQVLEINKEIEELAKMGIRALPDEPVLAMNERIDEQTKTMGLRILTHEQVLEMNGIDKLGKPLNMKYVFELDGFDDYSSISKWARLKVVESLCGDSNHEILLKVPEYYYALGPPSPFFPGPGVTCLFMLKPAPDLPDNEIGRSDVLFVPYDNYNNSIILLEWQADIVKKPRDIPLLDPEDLAVLKELISIECK